MIISPPPQIWIRLFPVRSFTIHYLLILFFPMVLQRNACYGLLILDEVSLSHTATHRNIHYLLIVLCIQRCMLRATEEIVGGGEGALYTVQAAVTQNWAAVFFRRLSRGSSCCHCFDLHIIMTGSCYVMFLSLDSCWNSNKSVRLFFRRFS